MAFINAIQTILRKSNGNILNFYVKDNILYFREFNYCVGWNKQVPLLNDVIHNQIDIKIDKNDEIYGVAKKENGEFMYIHSKDNRLVTKKLFDYKDEIYFIKYPQIFKNKNDIHLIYYIKHKHGLSSWGIVHNFFDGEEWSQNTITIVEATKIINPFSVFQTIKGLGIYYFHLVNGYEEIFYTFFNYKERYWTEPIQITNTKNNKLYLNSLIDGDIHHLTWSEFINNNLIVQYLRISIKNCIENIIPLSEPMNCSFPLFVKTNNILWNIWTETDKIVSCYSYDNGVNWSKPIITLDNNIDFLRYKFYSNYYQDKISYKLKETFGTYNPKISFVGFKNIIS